MEEIRATAAGQCYIAPNWDVEKNSGMMLSYCRIPSVGCN
jgi:hypothetical protein